MTRRGPQARSTQVRVRRRVPATAAFLWAVLATWTTSAPAQEIRLDAAHPAAAQEDLGAIDLTEVVMSATKTVTTVQETPAIITVVTDEEIRTRGYRSIDDILDTLPGFEARAIDWWYSDVFTRGLPRTLLVLWNGVPVYNPEWAGYELSRALPVEFVKRVEIVTGPGGVLWGANAFLGIVNVITYDGDSFGGVEFHAGGGSGPGMTNAGRSTLSFGQSLFGNRVKLYAGVNFSSDGGPMLNAPFAGHYSGLPPPSADGPTIGGLIDVPSRPERNTYLSVAGNVRGGPFTLDVFYPIVNRTYHQIAWTGNRTDIGIDGSGNLLDGESSRWATDFFVTSLTYRGRPLQRLGVVARGYFTGMEDISRRFVGVPPGLAATAVYVDQKFWTCPNDPCMPSDLTRAFDPGQPDPRWGVWRAGGSADFDLTLPARNRLLFGFEGFREHNDARASRYSDMLGGSISLQYFATDRIVGGAFLADEWRAHPRLTLHAGARFQFATDYELVPLFSGAAVWNPAGKLFLKVNYAEGFRPPPLIMANDNTDPAKGATNILPHFADNPDLRSEHSRSAEVSASLTALERHGALDKVILRGDYAFTLLEDLITDTQLVPTNAGTRYIHTGDLTLRADLRGGHSMFLSCGLNFDFDLDTGPNRVTANRKVVLGSRFELVRDHLDLSTLLVYLGPREDLNRYVSMREPFPGIAGAAIIRSSDAVIDCLPASVAWRLGMRVRNLWGKRLELDGFVYNVLNQPIYAPDVYYSKRIELFPVHGPGWSFFANAIVSL